MAVNQSNNITQGRPHFAAAITGALPPAGPLHTVNGEAQGAVFELAGRERELPAVSKLLAALAAGRPVTLVDGGFSGKTELAQTVFSLSGTPYTKFDLLQWTFERIKDPESRQLTAAMCSGVPAHFSLDKLLTSSHIGSDSVLRWRDFLRLFTDPQNTAIKELCANLLENLSGEVAHELKTSAGKMLVIDEFDFSIARPVSPAELRYFENTLRLAKNSGKQVLLIMHPEIFEDAQACAVLNQFFPQRTDVSMQRIPEAVARFVLARRGLAEGSRESLVQQFGGLPAAYKDLLSSAQSRDGHHQTAEDLYQQVERNLYLLARVMLPRFAAEIAGTLLSVARAETSPAAIPEALARRLTKTSFMCFNGRGLLHMPAVAQSALQQFARAG